MDGESVEVWWGSQSFSTNGTRIAIYNPTSGGGVRKFLSATHKPTRMAEMPAHSNGNKSFGSWKVQSFNLEPMTVVAIEVRSSTRGVIYTSGIIHIVVGSKDAPYIKVDAAVSPNPDAMYTSVPVFRGHGWVLTNKHDIARLGVIVPRHIANTMMDEEEIEELFEVTEIVPGSAFPRLLTTTDRVTKKTVTVAVPAEPTRRIRTRRKSV